MSVCLIPQAEQDCIELCYRMCDYCLLTRTLFHAIIQLHTKYDVSTWYWTAAALTNSTLNSSLLQINFITSHKN